MPQSMPTFIAITRLQLEKSCPERMPDFIVTATRSFNVYNGIIVGGVSTFTVYTNLSSADDRYKLVLGTVLGYLHPLR